MKKKFNVTGTCIPEKHYMVDISDKIKKIMNLIENEEYFVINRPRQYGKTTTLFLLNKKLKSDEEYLPIKISFEGIGDSVFENEKSFSKAFLQIVERNLILNNKNLSGFLGEERVKIQNLNDLSNVITKLVMKADKKVVLMIDEVDKSSNNQLFLSFLGMLRNKYLLRNEEEDITFHSVILAGVHDVKSLRLKIRLDEEHKYNSPWNIASDFDVDMSFSKVEIGTMLDEYVKDKSVKLDKGYFSERLYFYTSGYPFLVSKLCKIIDEKIMLEGELEWEKEYMDIAVKKLLNDDNTNFQSLIKNIENNSKLKEMIKSLIIDGNKINYNISNPIINMGILYGIFKNEDNSLKINNRIYEQLIYDYMSSLIETSTDVGFYNEKSNFIREDGNLDVQKILLKFQQFMKHEYSEKRKVFLEADGRLLFLAFISPIINGTGFAFKEVQGGEEKRFDIVITYNKKMKRLDERICDFINALTRLREALEKDITDDIIIDGIIKRFEFTFEQSWKVMKLYLEDQGILDEALAPRSTIKVAFKHNIISNGDLWIEMMLDRNRTSHMYDETTAKNIVERVKKVYINEFNDLEKFLKSTQEV